MSQTGKGIAASLIASCLFGMMYYYATLLGPLSGVEIYGWRIIVTVPFLTVFILRGGYWPLVSQVLNAAWKRKFLIPALCLSSFLLGIQLWLFMWAPLNGKALDVSLGYLLMPLVMVLCGRLLYKERLRLFQKLAVLCAALGVGCKVWQVGSLSLETMTVCLGFPAYFVLRKAMKTEHIGGLLIDMVLMLPASLADTNRNFSVLGGSQAAFDGACARSYQRFFRGLFCHCRAVASPGHLRAAQLCRAHSAGLGGSTAWRKDRSGRSSDLHRSVPGSSHSGPRRLAGAEKQKQKGVTSSLSTAAKFVV